MRRLRARKRRSRMARRQKALAADERADACRGAQQPCTACHTGARCHVIPLCRGQRPHRLTLLCQTRDCRPGTARSANRLRRAGNRVSGGVSAEARGPTSSPHADFGACDTVSGIECVARLRRFAPRAVPDRNESDKVVLITMSAGTCLQVRFRAGETCRVRSTRWTLGHSPSPRVPSIALRVRFITRCHPCLYTGRRFPPPLPCACDAWRWSPRGPGSIDERLEAGYAALG
jgi:hypothetical protein